MTAVGALTRTHPVVEVFGPTIQGEGAMAGLPTYFVRMGGCDWRCAWCDSMHAVEPALVRKAPRLNADQIVALICGHGSVQANWVTLSGGNPVLHDLERLVVQLQMRGMQVAVETQGSVWRPWLEYVDHLTVSPKPPSSEMATLRHRERVYAFLSQMRVYGVEGSLKIVVFNDDDLRYALDTAATFPWLPFYVSCGTDSLGKEPLEATAARYRWLCEAVASHGGDAARRARVLPQLHVIAWGHKLGV